MPHLKTAHVKIWEEMAGTVIWDSAKGYALFEYESSFLSKGWDVSPIHMRRSDAQRGENKFAFPHIDLHAFHGLPGLLASALPDDFGSTIFDLWLRRSGQNPISVNPVERLCYIGNHGMGALEFTPRMNSHNLAKSSSIDIPKIRKLIQKELFERSIYSSRWLKIRGAAKADDLLDLVRVCISAGGAVPKAVIAVNDQGHMISGQGKVPKGYEYWMIKFGGVAKKNSDSFRRIGNDNRVEYAYSLMAQQAGIDMAECRLIEENERAHFMTKRFDRTNGEKIHVLSLACMDHLGWNPVDTASYEDAFRVMHFLKLSYPEQEQQYRRMVFNAIARNTDDHTKNISYLMKKDGVWKLSPAYDITFTYKTGDLLGRAHKMKINGKQTNFNMEDFLNIAKTVGIKNAEKIIAQVQEAISQWPDFANQAKVDPEQVDYILWHHLNATQLEVG